ncbi:kinase-like protein [Cylindrobasidium torrendii FP15055 ss-10]|uniref:non-specific serine/threonine protein kinase n=1 Tax=Cylindrobasidium torrendii FP15055 ss-10 TaxID=1314674 RepID=A0A0D7B7E6_9AGAR|nr:kinase-like protein [Cylindrobasidium torrendii FP15055 ss-10]
MPYASRTAYRAFRDDVETEEDPDLRERYLKDVRRANKGNYSARRLGELHDALLYKSDERYHERRRFIARWGGPSHTEIANNLHAYFNRHVRDAPFREGASAYYYQFSSKSLGEGGQGSVRLGLRRKEGQPRYQFLCAIKKIRYENGGDGKMWAKKEAENMLRVWGCMAFTQIWACQDNPLTRTMFIAMEYFNGCELLLWKHNFLVISDALLRHVAREVLVGLDFLHTRAGLIHRDLSMRNIMMDVAYCVKIIDLGYATSITHPDDQQGVGFKAFRDPDIKRIRRITPAADIWSLGMVILHLNYGYRYPCDGARVVDQWVSVHLKTESEDPRHDWRKERRIPKVVLDIRFDSAAKCKDAPPA